MYSTFFSYPFDTNSSANSIAVDSTGNAYIMGIFPVSGGPFAAESMCQGLAKFDPAGANLLFSFAMPVCGTLAIDA